MQGETNRVIGQHQLNRESSRSHSVFIAHTTCVHEGAGGTAMVSTAGSISCTTLAAAVAEAAQPEAHTLLSTNVGFKSLDPICLQS